MGISFAAADMFRCSLRRTRRVDSKPRRRGIFPTKKGPHTHATPFLFLSGNFETGDLSPRRAKDGLDPEICHVPKIWDSEGTGLSG